MNQIIKGKQSLIFTNPPYIISAASVAGSKEGGGGRSAGKTFRYDK